MHHCNPTTDTNQISRHCRDVERAKQPISTYYVCQLRTMQRRPDCDATYTLPGALAATNTGSSRLLVLAFAAAGQTKWHLICARKNRRERLTRLVG